MAEPNFDMIDAKTFLAVDTEGSIRAGARRLHVSPNTLRYRLRRLERRTGAVLFRRTRTGVEVTADGQRMRRIARAMLAETDPGLDFGNDVLVRPGQVTISCGEGIGSLCG